MKKEKVCGNCEHVGTPKKFTKGSFMIEIVLWCMFIIPGLIYSLWRVSSRVDACRKCNSTSLVPTDSPTGRRIIKRNSTLTVDDVQ